MKWLIITLLATMALVGAFGLGKSTAKPETIIKEVPVEKVITAVKTLPSVTTTIWQRVEVPVIEYIEVPRQTRYFESVDELEAWLDTETFYSVSFPSCDCDDFAKWLQEDAEQAGYRISTEKVNLPNGKKHFINSAFIGNGFYVIEPQTHTVKFDTLLD